MDERLNLLIGNKTSLLKNKKVLLIGLGGVGGYALEILARSFIGTIIIVDNDQIELSNLNRQLLSLNSNLNQDKVEVASNRILDINPNCHIIKIREFINKDNINLLFDNQIDYLIDACDTIETKKLIIKECLKRRIKFISSMGTGNKIDPTKLVITDIRKTTYDPIAKIIRKMVNDEHLKGKIMVVSSTEKVLKREGIGSNAYVPATAGILLSSYVINNIIGDINE